MLKTRARRILLGVVLVTLFLLAFGYHALNAVVRVIPPYGFEMLYNGLVLVGYGVVFLLLSRYFEHRSMGPLRVFWSCLLAGLLLLIVGLLVYSFGRAPEFVNVPDGPDLPKNLGTAVKVHVLGLLETLFGFILLLHLRKLVLYRRTKASVRNWIVMMGLMTVTALSMFMADQIRLVTGILFFLTVGAAVVNSFRLSWIVFLSFREKAAIVAVTVLLTTLLGFLLFSGGFLAELDDATVLDFSVFGEVNSYPMNMFVTLCVIFGLLYSTTTFLSLLFHLPTTSDIRQKADELAAVHSVSRLTGDVFDQHKLFSAITASPVDAGTAQTAWLAVIDPKSGSLRPQVVSTNRITPDRVEALIDTESLWDDMSQRSTPLLLNHAAADHRIRARPGDGIESLLAVPLMARGDITGALFVTKEIASGFEREDINTIQTFADQAALALDNARLFDEQLEKERLSRELAIAHEVQQKLLPQRVPEIEGALLAASSVPALEVGGDYYDFVHLDDERLGIIVADVSGKGTSAAFYMAELKGVFQSISRLTSSPSAFLRQANEALGHSMEKNVFISAVYGILDRETESLTLARAGHCPAVMVRKTGEARFLRTGGMGLGLDPGPLFAKTLTEERITLEPGDTFVLYTDGIVESRSPAGEEYGYTRLQDAVCKHRRQDAETIHAAILEDLCIFLDRDQYDDDMTLVVLKWIGHGQTGRPRPVQASSTLIQARTPVSQGALSSKP